MYERRCEHCDRLMVAYRTDARFCSPKCRVYANRGSKMPRTMVEAVRWMRWTPTKRGEKTTKRPITVAGRAASSTDAATWTSYAEARRSTAGAGLGFALGNGIGCVDLDHCIRADGTVEPWAEAFLAICPPTFAEVSVSGTGIHVFGLLPEQPGRNLRSRGVTVEVYSTGRFIAVTGDRFRNAPMRLADLTEAVASLT